MDQNIFRYTWRHSRREQIWLLVVVSASLPFYFLSLDLPKRIINGPIQGQGFDSPIDTEKAFQVAFGLPSFLGGQTITLFDGFDLGRIGILVYLCSLFLAFVLINGYFKFYISTFKGRVGERMLRRLRFQLVDQLMRFPLPQFRRMRSSEVATMVKDEVEPLGGFIGDAFVQPAYLLSQAVTAMVFILMQSLTLGLIAAAVVAVQVVLVPRLRRRLLVMGRMRQLTARQLAGRVGEIVEGISGIRVNDTSNWERAEISGRLGRIFFIRFDIYQWKFLVKFINNLLSQVTPFIFYLIGGYLAITGRLDIGQLVAVVAAYKDLPSPLKDLIDWDQQRLDVQVKYTQVVEAFAVANVLDPALQRVSPESPPRIARDVVANNVVVRDESGATLLDTTSLKLVPGETVAATGMVGAGGEYLAETLARLLEPSSGRVLIDGAPIETLPDAFTGRRIGYAESSTYFPQSSLKDALIYGLRHAPLRVIEKEAGEERRRLTEALASGNPNTDVADDWVDYAAAGAEGPDDLLDRIREVLVVMDFENDVYRLGLRSRFPAAPPADLKERLLAARSDLRQRLASSDAEDYVETFDPERYTSNASVLENLVFGVADPAALAGIRPEDHPFLIATVAETGLQDKLFAMGQKIAETLIDLFGDLDPNNPLLQRIDLMAAEDIDKYRAIMRRVASASSGAVDNADRQTILKLAFGYVEPRHRLGLLDESLQADVLAARRTFRANLPAELKAAVHFHEPSEIDPAATIQDNVLFGRIVDTFADAADKVNALLRETMDALTLTDAVIDLGLAFDIGSGAKRLSAAQQQKLALARALLKRPDFLVVNRALSALDSAAQDATVQRVLQFVGDIGERGAAVYWVLGVPASAEHFDRVVAFENGHVVKTAEEPAKEAGEAQLERVG